jgi:hypothetical protein
MTRRVTRDVVEPHGVYFVTDGMLHVGTVHLDSGEYVAVDWHGDEVGRFRLLSDAVAALPVRAS